MHTSFDPSAFSAADSSANAADEEVLDLLGVGLGPFNLGLAALCEPLVDRGELTAAFFDQREEFCWHPGMMIPGATIQVPFLADLVTMADPTSAYSFLNYCKLQGRIHQFYIKEDFNPLREEYSDYCAWVAGQLSTLEWNSTVTDVAREGQYWVATITTPAGTRRVKARHIVSGIGTRPFIPAGLQAPEGTSNIWHSADYLEHKAEILAADSVTIIGSGQSAAEIYADLMEPAAYRGSRLDWFTRSPRFFPMEYTKLTLEMTSPEYADFFHGLDMKTRDHRNREQRNLYKGISGDLINEIYDTYYRLSITKNLPQPFDSTLRAGWSASLVPQDSAALGANAGQPIRLHLTHEDTGERLTHQTSVLILATGYKAPDFPGYLESARPHIQFDAHGRLAVRPDFSIDNSGTIFVQNAEEHTHSLTAPDLGMGPWRNSIIIQRITGKEYYPIERSIAFQSFGA